MCHEGRDGNSERCHGCGERYFRLSAGLCLRCLGDPPRLAAERRRVIEYARTHPRVSVAVAAAATGVSPARVTELVDAGHLVAQGPGAPTRPPWEREAQAGFRAPRRRRPSG